MHTPASPVALQQAIGQALLQALQRSGTAHPPAGLAPATGHGLPVSDWLVPPARHGSGVGAAAQALTAAQVSTPVERARLAGLLQRCLLHYRSQLRQDEQTDDAGAALACCLAAVLQAVVQQAVTPARWQGTLDWIRTWAEIQPLWDAAPLEQRQDFFERMAILAAALGEWAVQASRQPGQAPLAARSLAKLCLQQQLGLQAAPLVQALQRFGVCDGDADDPSWGDAELPTVPAFGAGDHRL
jgi:hypothetical protein